MSNVSSLRVIGKGLDVLLSMPDHLAGCDISLDFLGTVCRTGSEQVSAYVAFCHAKKFLRTCIDIETPFFSNYGT